MLSEGRSRRNELGCAFAFVLAACFGLVVWVIGVGVTIYLWKTL